MGIKKLCSRFVPRFLTGDMQQRRFECCQRNLETFENLGDAFLKNIITEDETPLSLYIPETKRESVEWKMPVEKPSLKMRTGTSHKKCLMLTIFWDMKGFLKVDFAASGVKINSDYYVQLIKEARRKRQKRGNNELWLLHDNAPIHTSHLTTAAIGSCGLSLVPHPPYSPDLVISTSSDN
jgi:[histone H3]-lysine36 N-dimethyltransferase SETMAR